MSVFRLYRKQVLPIPLGEAWDFFSDPKNLKVITPSYMGFDILSGADQKMYPGQIIQYTVRPLLGLPIRWVTEIAHVVDGEFFVDEQRFGPYAFWHHKHFFKEVAGGVEMVDIVDYKLPFFFLGNIVHALYVKNKLKEIFDFRFKKLDEIFG